MSLTSLDGVPLIPVGMPSRFLFPSVPSLGNVTTMDATNDAVIMIGQIVTEDGGSHTIDTSGSSSLGWRCGAMTFANGGTTVKVGIAPVSTTLGPPARASHASNVIAFDVSASFTGGGGGIGATAWQEHVPTSGSKTIAHGDFVAFAVQMTARGGADSLVVQCFASPSGAGGHPTVSAFDLGGYISTSFVPNAVITFSDGARGYFFGGSVASSASTQAWANNSATKEYGNFIQLPFPAKVHGLIFSAATQGDTDAILYSDPLGTPSAQKTVSLDTNTTSVTVVPFFKMFTTPFDLAANTPYAVVLKPTTTQNATLAYKTYNNAAHQFSENGSNCYAINRDTGAFAQQNSGLDRFSIGLLIGAFDDGVSAGGSSVARVIGG